MNRPARALSLALLLALAAPAAADAAQLLPWRAARRPGQPAAVVVHGINPTPHDLDVLCDDLRARGYGVYQFEYDSHAPLRRSADALAAQVRGALADCPAPRLALVAHSMGGLVARHALRADHPARLAEAAPRVDLVTVASPFGGFFSANFSVLDFGLGPEAFHDLGTWSGFIKRPGALHPAVAHTKVETDERGREVRRPGAEPADDSVISLGNQRQRDVDRGARRSVTLARGHSEVVLDGGRISSDLSCVLDEALGPRQAQRTGFQGRLLAALRALVARARAQAAEAQAPGLRAQRGLADALQPDAGRAQVLHSN